MAKDINFDDPRIQTKVHLILKSKALSISEAVSLLNKPGWGEHPDAPLLLERKINHRILRQQSEEDKLQASDVVKIFHDPVWRDIPSTTDLLIAWVQHPSLRTWEQEDVHKEVNKLLKDDFWKKRLRDRLGREDRWWGWLINPPSREVTLNNIKLYASCPDALTE